MKRKRCTDEQAAFAPGQADSGSAAEEIRRLKQLEEEGAELERLVVDPGLDGAMPQETPRRKGGGAWPMTR